MPAVGLAQLKQLLLHPVNHTTSPKDKSHIHNVFILGSKHKLVGTFCPVNHNGLYHCKEQTSICLLVILHISHQTTNSLKSRKSVLTQIYIKQNIQMSPFGTAPAKKAHMARPCWYCGPFCQFINTRFDNSIKKEWTEERI